MSYTIGSEPTSEGGRGATARKSQTAVAVVQRASCDDGDAKGIGRISDATGAAFDVAVRKIK